MLVLSRQRDETIMIGDSVEITIVDIRGDKVRLGITAPTTVAVHRKEVYEAIRKENEQAARLDGEELAHIRPPGAKGAPRAASLSARPPGPLSPRRVQPAASQTPPTTPTTTRSGAATEPTARSST